MGEYGDLFGKAVAEQLRAERSAARLTQKQLAERAGMSDQSVMRYLNGTRDIPIAALADIANALGVSVEVIVERATQRLRQRGA